MHGPKSTDLEGIQAQSWLHGDEVCSLCIIGGGKGEWVWHGDDEPQMWFVFCLMEFLKISAKCLDDLLRSWEYSTDQDIYAFIYLYSTRLNLKVSSHNLETSKVTTVSRLIQAKQHSLRGRKSLSRTLPSVWAVIKAVVHSVAPDI